MTDKSVLITGGTSDIGRQLIELVLQKTEYRIISTYKRNRRDFHPSGRVRELFLDASDEGSVKSLSSEVAELNIGYFLQVHGTSKKQDPIVEQSFEALDYHFRVNVFSSVLILSSLLKNMSNKNFGRIVLMNTASSNHGGGLNTFGYGMSKHSTTYLVKHLAKHFSKYNILSNCVSPGFISTKFHSEVLQRSMEEIEKRERSVLLGRAGEPEEVAELMYYLAFCNHFVTGQTVKIDGGDFI